MKVTVIDKRTPDFQTYEFETHQVNKIGERDGKRLDALLGGPMFEAVFKRGIQRDFFCFVYATAEEAQRAAGKYSQQHILNTAGRDALTDDQLASYAYNLMLGKKGCMLSYDIMTGRWYLNQH